MFLYFLLVRIRSLTAPPSCPRWNSKPIMAQYAAKLLWGICFGHGLGTGSQTPNTRYRSHGTKHKLQSSLGFFLKDIIWHGMSHFSNPHHQLCQHLQHDYCEICVNANSDIGNDSVMEMTALTRVGRLFKVASGGSVCPSVSSSTLSKSDRPYKDITHSNQPKMYLLLAAYLILFCFILHPTRRSVRSVCPLI